MVLLTHDGKGFDFSVLLRLICVSRLLFTVLHARETFRYQNRKSNPGASLFKEKHPNEQRSTNSNPTSTNNSTNTKTVRNGRRKPVKKRKGGLAAFIARLHQQAFNCTSQQLHHCCAGMNGTKESLISIDSGLLTGEGLWLTKTATVVRGHGRLLP